MYQIALDLTKMKPTTFLQNYLIKKHRIDSVNQQAVATAIYNESIKIKYGKRNDGYKADALGHRADVSYNQKWLE